jgi:flagellar basal body-associated protein FliL
LKKLTVPIVVVVIVVALAGVAMQLGWLAIPGLSGEPRRGAPGSEKGEMGPVVKLNPLIINLKDEGGMSYLKATIVLEVEQKNKVEEVTKRLPMLTDMAILTLGEKRLQDLEKPESKESLKQELLAKMNQSFPSKRINRVYFDEFLFE